MQLTKFVTIFVPSAKFTFSIIQLEGNVNNNSAGRIIYNLPPSVLL